MVTDFLSTIDRRAFLKIVAVTGLAGLIYPKKLLASLVPGSLSEVAIVEDQGATRFSTIYQDVVEKMFDSAVRSICGENDVGEAWKSLFPGINLNSTIAIKVNCINRLCSTHPPVTYAVVEGLKKMSFGGVPFPENHIIIYDRTSSELNASTYTVNRSGTGVWCYGTDGAYSHEVFSINGVNERISKIASANYLVNMSVLKNHGFSGFTMCLKNHYGSCDRPDLLHGNNCDPFIPELFSVPTLLDKPCVHICDAMFGIANGGPMGGAQFRANTIIMSTDPVAVDYCGSQILADNNCGTLGIAHYLDTAAQAPYNLGTNDPKKMAVYNIHDPSTGVKDGNEASTPESTPLQQNHPNPFTHTTDIRFYVSEPGNVSLTVYDVKGRRIRHLAETSLPGGWHSVSWDGRSDGGDNVASGVYYCQLKTKKYTKAIIMQLLK